MKHIDMQPNPESWICYGGKTIRAGCKKCGIWFNVKSQEDADKIVESMRGMSISELKALHDDKLLDELMK